MPSLSLSIFAPFPLFPLFSPLFYIVAAATGAPPAPPAPPALPAVHLTSRLQSNSPTQLDRTVNLVSPSRDWTMQARTRRVHRNTRSIESSPSGKFGAIESSAGFSRTLHFQPRNETGRNRTGVRRGRE